MDLIAADEGDDDDEVAAAAAAEIVQLPKQPQLEGAIAAAGGVDATEQPARVARVVATTVDIAAFGTVQSYWECSADVRLILHHRHPAIGPRPAIDPWRTGNWQQQRRRLQRQD